MLSAAEIKQAARQAGFDSCGIAAAGPLNDFASQLGDWLSLGMNADMVFMAQHVEKRVDPAKLVPGARSVVSVLLGCRPAQTMKGTVRIAQYAYGADYHREVKSRLFVMLERLKTLNPELQGRPFVDTAPISDKLWAWRCGLGWIGRNTLLVSPDWGTFCSLGELVIDQEADVYDTPLPNRCGDCQRCVASCPNGALAQEGRPCLDARRCASYHTIENRAESLPQGIALSGYAFGCDVCQLACPYNAEALRRETADPERMAQLEQLAQCDEAQFKSITRHSAMDRISFVQWRRNVEACTQQQ